MTKIKICGLTREEDAILAAILGADFLGFVFVEESPRRVDAETVRRIADGVRALSNNPPKIVGVFRNAIPADVRRIAERATLDFVQLQGTESNDDIEAIALPVIKAIHVGGKAPETNKHPGASWLLFDTYDERRAGGTGRCFDWSHLAGYDRGRPFLLAGGITPENAAAAIKAVRPDAIDLASGVESALGIKDKRKLELLFERVRGPSGVGAEIGRFAPDP
jgi:phosphoribosylanthranilate isomerase